MLQMCVFKVMISIGIVSVCYDHLDLMEAPIHTIVTENHNNSCHHSKHQPLPPRVLPMQVIAMRMTTMHNYGRN